MTTTRSRVAAALALTAAGALLPLLAVATPAQALPLAADCTAEEAAVADAIVARDAAAADLADYLATDYASAVSNQNESRISKNARLGEKSAAEVAVQEASDAYALDPSEANAAALAQARQDLVLAKQALTYARDLFQQNRATLAAAKLVRLDKAALRNSTKAATVAAKAALEACQQPEVYATVTDLRGAPMYVTGDVTIHNLAQGSYRLASSAEDCYDALCGNLVLVNSSPWTIPDVYLGICDTTAANDFTFYRSDTLAEVASVRVGYADACIV